jgi:hypothetical protein
MSCLIAQASSLLAIPNPGHFSQAFFGFFRSWLNSGQVFD